MKIYLKSLLTYFCLAMTCYLSTYTMKLSPDENAHNELHTTTKLNNEANRMIPKTGSSLWNATITPKWKNYFQNSSGVRYKKYDLYLNRNRYLQADINSTRKATSMKTTISGKHVSAVTVPQQEIEKARENLGKRILSNTQENVMSADFTFRCHQSLPCEDEHSECIIKKNWWLGYCKCKTGYVLNRNMSACIAIEEIKRRYIWIILGFVAMVLIAFVMKHCHFIYDGRKMTFLELIQMCGRRCTRSSQVQQTQQTLNVSQRPSRYHTPENVTQGVTRCNTFENIRVPLTTAAGSTLRHVPQECTRSSISENVPQEYIRCNTSENSPQRRIGGISSEIIQQIVRPRRSCMPPICTGHNTYEILFEEADKPPYYEEVISCDSSLSNLKSQDEENPPSYDSLQFQKKVIDFNES